MFSLPSVNTKRVAYIIILLVEISLITLKSNCLRIEGDEDDSHHGHHLTTGSLQAHSTGWRGVSSTWSPGGSHRLTDKPKSSTTSTTTSTPASRTGKLVEWDDDDLNDHLNVNLQLKDNHLHATDQDVRSPFVYSPSSSFARVKRPSSGSRSNRLNKLIFHGQIKHQNQTRRLVDGLDLYVNTHNPVVISRRMQPFSLPVTSTSSPASSEDYMSTTINSTVFMSRTSEESPSSSIKNSVDSSGHLDTFETNWRPLVVISRSRRFSKSAKNPTATSTLSESYETSTKPKHHSEESQPIKKSLDYLKWRPIVRDSPGSKESHESDLSATLVESRPETKVATRPVPTHSPIEDPFDNEDIEPIRAPKKNQKDQIVRPDSDARWTPLETSTSIPDLLASPTTTQSSVTTKSPSTNSSEVGAQRSASDLNYIYSSQPVVQSSAAGGGGGGSYYSNYLVPPSPQQPAIEQPQVPTIIDTTSGQTPEMIVERVPDVGPQVAQPVDSYSMPQTMSSFQPAQPLPSRQPTYGAYSQDQSAPLVSSSAGGGHGYGNYGGQQASRQQPVAPVVRQEHHYHYYNSQRQAPSSQQDRQQPVIQQPAPSSAPQTVIRELQPIMITQPFIQQQQQQPPASSTAAPPPQIIREIVREVPMQTVQVQQAQLPQIQRIVVPQPFPVPVAAQVSRDFGDHSSASRLIRQISNTMPQVAIRMPPALSQFRLQMPPLQLPLRLGQQQNQAPVTRQTGSFLIPPMPKKTTTFLTETQVMPSHTTIMQTTQFTPATRTTVYTTDHQVPAPSSVSRDVSGPASY